MLHRDSQQCIGGTGFNSWVSYSDVKFISSALELYYGTISKTVPRLKSVTFDEP